MYLGDINAGSVLDFKITTTAATDGAPTTLLGSPAMNVYRDDGTTESAAGITLTVDFDGVIGLNNVHVDTSADATFYASGHNYHVVISSGTVGGTSAVGYVAGEFSINNRSTVSLLQSIDYIISATPQATADVLLGRNLAGGSDGGRTVADALRVSRNKVVIAAGTITVYAEDDTTVAWTGTLTTDASADPITAMDPA